MSDPAPLGHDDGREDVATSAPPARSHAGRIAPWIAVAVAVVMAGLFWVLVRAAPDDGAESAYTPLTNKPAPAIRTTTLDGKPFDLQQRKGSWVVLNFFNSTCVPCVREHPELVRFATNQEQLGPNGAELYTIVSTNDREGDAAAFFAASGGTWPVLTDADAHIQVAFGVSKVPETWIIDPDGRIVYRTITQVSDDGLRRTLDELRLAYGQATG